MNLQAFWAKYHVVGYKVVVMKRYVLAYKRIRLVWISFWWPVDSIKIE